MLERFLQRLDGWPLSRLAFGSALASLLTNGLFYLCCFPPGRQFDKYVAAAADFLGNTLPAERLGDFSPFTFWLHLAAAKLFGSSLYPLLLLQLLAMATATALLFLLLQRTLTSTATALVGVLLFIFSGPVVNYAVILEPEAFLVLFLLGFLWFVMATGARARLWAGLCLGLCLLTRPTLLPLLLLIPVWLKLQGGKNGAILRFIALPLFALLLLSLQNFMTQGSLSPTVMNPGFVFFEGNNPLSTGQSAAYPPLVQEMKVDLPGAPDSPHLLYRQLARLDLRRNLSTAEANRYWADKALNYISQEPVAWLRLIATKAHFILHSYRRFDIQTAYEYSRNLAAASIPLVPFGVMAAAGLVGMLLSLRAWRDYFPLFAVTAVQIGVMLATYVSDRQRLVLLPALIFFALVALRHGLAPFCRRWLLLPAIGVGALILAVPTSIMQDNDHLWQGYIASDREWLDAMAQRSAGRLPEAAAAAARSYAAAPWLRDYSRPAFLVFERGFAVAALRARPGNGQSCSERFDQGMLLVDANELAAADLLLAALAAEGCRFDRVALQSSRPEFFRARIALQQGDETLARHLYTEALQQSPGDPFVLADLSVLRGEEPYQRQLVELFGETHALFLTGLAAVELNRSGGGRPLQELVSRLPELRRSQIYLAAARGIEGDDRAAAQLYQQATGARIDPVLLERKITGIFQRLAAQDPANPANQHNLARVLAHFGHFAAAISAERHALQLAPSPVLESSLRELENLAAQSRP